MWQKSPYCWQKVGWLSNSNIEVGWCFGSSSNKMLTEKIQTTWEKHFSKSTEGSGKVLQKNRTVLCGNVRMQLSVLRRFSVLIVCVLAGYFNKFQWNLEESLCQMNECLVFGAGPAVVTLHDGAFLNTDYFLMNYCTDLNEKHLCHDRQSVFWYMFYLNVLNLNVKACAGLEEVRAF